MESSLTLIEVNHFAGQSQNVDIALLVFKNGCLCFQNNTEDDRFLLEFICMNVIRILGECIC